jgi:hypothetical protein
MTNNFRGEYLDMRERERERLELIGGLRELHSKMLQNLEINVSNNVIKLKRMSCTMSEKCTR